MIDCIVYALCDPLTHQIRYIGKSERGLSRPFGRPGQYRHNADLSAWIHNLAATGQDYVVLILARAKDAERLSKLETYWIKLGVESGWPLCNLASARPGLPRPYRLSGSIKKALKKKKDPKRESTTWDIKSWRRDRKAGNSEPPKPAVKVVPADFKGNILDLLK